MTDRDTDKIEVKEFSKVNVSDGFFSIFISTFISVFVAEIGDKTQIATLLLSAKSGKPAIVFTGAALALICSTLVVVILGSLISKRVSQVRIKFISAIIMMFLGLGFGYQSIHLYLSPI